MGEAPQKEAAPQPKDLKVNAANAVRQIRHLPHIPDHQINTARDPHKEKRAELERTFQEAKAAGFSGDEIRDLAADMELQDAQEASRELARLRLETHGFNLSKTTKEQFEEQERLEGIIEGAIRFGIPKSDIENEGKAILEAARTAELSKALDEATNAYLELQKIAFSGKTHLAHPESDAMHTQRIALEDRIRELKRKHGSALDIREYERAGRLYSASKLTSENRPRFLRYAKRRTEELASIGRQSENFTHMTPDQADRKKELEYEIWCDKVYDKVTDEELQLVPKEETWQDRAKLNQRKAA